jgi:tRNA-uridine 2-sulfurtransferase
MSTKDKVLVAMSGGVDSTVAALLLQSQGYEVIGVTMKTWDYEGSGAPATQSGCCSLDAIHDARAMAVRFNIPHYVLDLRKEFEDKIVSNFVEEYLNGRTPNPCVLCNRLIKWDDLLKRADELGCRYIATGHYAQVMHEGGRWFLRQGEDKSKDQTYVLWGLSQENLARTLFPLGRMSKPETRKIAEEHGLEHIARKSESYEICFIPDDDYRRFLIHKVPGLEAKVNGGDFVTSDGKVLGKHKGYPFYTIGQRKGLVVAVGHPLYVNRIDPLSNRVTLGSRDELDRDSLTICDVNLMKYGSFGELQGMNVRIRYHDKGAEAAIRLHEGKISVRFNSAVQGVAPGQSAVIYEGTDLVAGGIIET